MPREKKTIILSVVIDSAGCRFEESFAIYVSIFLDVYACMHKFKKLY